MICKSCRAGAFFLSADAPRDLVAKHHAECRGGTWCDCQHATESALNLSLLSEQQRGAKAVSE